MSITIKYILPQQYPAFHKGLWVVDSDNKTDVGFEYVCDLYSASTPNVFINRFPLPPRPYDGYGLFNTQVMKSKIDQSKDAYEALVGWKAAPNGAVNYKLVFGEKTDQWEFYDNYFSAGAVGFTGTTPHGFVVGDEVAVAQDTPYTNASYEGFAIITSIPDQYAIVINKSWGNVTGPEGGTVKKADGTAIIVSGMTTGQTSWVVGYTLDEVDLEGFDILDYSPCVTGAGAARLLTDQPSSFHMREDGRILLSVPQFSGSVASCVIKTYDRNNNSLGMYSISISAGPLLNTKQMLYLGIGPYDIDNQNPTVVSGATEFLNSATSYYDFYLYSTGSTIGSETKRVYLDRQCEEIEYNILFMDKKGTFSTFSFTADDTIKFENKKQTFLYDGLGSYGLFGAGGFKHRTEDRGYTVFDSRQIKRITVRTKPMTEDESDYMMQLFSSPVCYWMKEPEVWVPIVINDAQPERQKYENDSFIQYEVEFSMGFNERINW